MRNVGREIVSMITCMSFVAEGQLSQEKQQEILNVLMDFSDSTAGMWGIVGPNSHLKTLGGR